METCSYHVLHCVLQVLVHRWRTGERTVALLALDDHLTLLLYPQLEVGGLFNSWCAVSSSPGVLYHQLQVCCIINSMCADYQLQVRCSINSRFKPRLSLLVDSNFWPVLFTCSFFYPAFYSFSNSIGKQSLGVLLYNCWPGSTPGGCCRIFRASHAVCKRRTPSTSLWGCNGQSIGLIVSDNIVPSWPGSTTTRNCQLQSTPQTVTVDSPCGLLVIYKRHFYDFLS